LSEHAARPVWASYRTSRYRNSTSSWKLRFGSARSFHSNCIGTFGALGRRERHNPVIIGNEKKVVRETDSVDVPVARRIVSPVPARSRCA
jgi:hypothetical protein